MKKQGGIVLLVWLVSYTGFCQSGSDSFLKVFNLMEQRNFFKAAETYTQEKEHISKEYQLYTEACLANAFNKLQASEEKIDELGRLKTSLPDSMVYKLLLTSEDNALKSYQYKKAKAVVQNILTHYSDHLSSYKKDDLENDLNIYTALENTPPQEVIIKEPSDILLQKDMIGLNNLNVWTQKDTLNFIFDTGANISTTTVSVAKRLGMELIPSQIKVMSITGKEVQAQMAVCSVLYLGHVEIHHAVFLVFPDEALAFPQMNYQINGILGFPVIEAFKEVQITTDGHFIIPEKPTDFTGLPGGSNMAIAGLTPLIYLNKQHYSFDTGAAQTMLFHKFYIENKEEIEANYPPSKITFGGAGGSTQLDGYMINHTFTVFGQPVTLKNISVLKEKIKETETVYGNIGQDLIQQFHTMILNFDQMFIVFVDKVTD